MTPTIARAQQTLAGFPAVAGPQRRTRAHHADVAAAAAALGIDEEDDDGAAPSAAAAAADEEDAEAEEEEEAIGEREASASNSLVPLQAPPAGLLFDGTPQTGGAAAAALIAAAAEASGLGPEHYVDITELLTLPQAEAAEKLHVPTSTLSKRWKEAARGRKWPHRAVAKLDKQILCLLHNIPQGSTAQHLPPEVEASLALLMRRRQEMLRPTVIRL